MTIAAGYDDRHDTGGLARWGVSLAIVLALHAAVALYLIAHPVPIEPPGAPPAAVLIDLAPEPAPPPPAIPVPEPQPQIPPPPQLAPPEPPPPLPDIPLPPEIPPPPKAVLLPKPPPRPPKPVIERPPPVPTPAPPITAPPPPAMAPPAPAAPSAAAVAGARNDWYAKVSATLARNKRYPRAAMDQHQQGTASIRFSVDRSGRVLSAQLANSSGFPLLDEEAQALVQRTALPAPPAELPGNQFEMVLPLSFTLR